MIFYALLFGVFRIFFLEKNCQGELNGSTTKALRNGII